MQIRVQANISVFITSYNQKEWLECAIESVLGQSLMPKEIIIVDDCSSDGSRELVLDYQEKHPALIKPIFHAENMGVTKTRVDALSNVGGDYVTYLDGDDLFLPNKLEVEYNYLCENPQVDIVYSNTLYMDSGGAIKGLWYRGSSNPMETFKMPQGKVFRQVFSRAFPRSSLFRMEMVRYKSWESVGFHDLNLDLYEDFDMRIRLTKHLTVGHVDSALAAVRYHGAGLSSASIDKHITALRYIYRKNQALLRDLSLVGRCVAAVRFKVWMYRLYLYRGARCLAGLFPRRGCPKR